MNTSVRWPSLMRRPAPLAALVLLAASLSNSTAAELFLSGQQAEQLIVSSYGEIIWKASCEGNVAPGTQTRISRQMLDRPVSPSSIISRTTCTPFDRIPGRIAFSGSSAFYVNGQGGIRTGNGSSSATLGNTPDPGRITSAGLVAVSFSHVYWTDEEGEFYDAARLWRLPRGGGTPELVASYVTSPRLYFKKLHAPPTGVVFALLSDERLVFYAFRPGFPPNPGQWIQTTIASRVTGVTFSSDRICWVEKKRRRHARHVHQRAPDGHRHPHHTRFGSLGSK